MWHHFNRWVLREYPRVTLLTTTDELHCQKLSKSKPTSLPSEVLTTRILGGKGNRTRRSQKASCRATTSRRPPTRYERSHTRKVNLCIIRAIILTIVASRSPWLSSRLSLSAPAHLDDSTRTAQVSWFPISRLPSGGIAVAVPSIPIAQRSASRPSRGTAKYRIRSRYNQR